MADGVIPDAKSWEMIVRAVRIVLGDMFGDGGPHTGQAGRGGVRFLVCTLNGSLSAGGSQTAKALRWNGSAWATTTETLTVRDYRDSGNAIASGRRCVCVYQFGAWWVISTRC